MASARSASTLKKDFATERAWASVGRPAEGTSREGHARARAPSAPSSVSALAFVEARYPSA